MEFVALAQSRGAPDARILLLGYPNPFPATLRPGSACNAWFAPADIAD